jgi:hypothetical protein
MNDLVANLLGAVPSGGGNFHARANVQLPLSMTSLTDADMALIRAGNVIHHFGWSWKEKHGGTAYVKLGPYTDAKVGEGEFLEALFEAGYRLPRWWQMSRWGEKRLSKDRCKVIAKMEEREPNGLKGSKQD